MLNGQVPEQVPHWMQLCSCSQPGTLWISFPNPLTRSPSYLIVRVIRIIMLMCLGFSRRPLPRRHAELSRNRLKLSWPKKKSHLVLAKTGHPLSSAPDCQDWGARPSRSRWGASRAPLLCPFFPMNSSSDWPRSNTRPSGLCLAGRQTRRARRTRSPETPWPGPIRRKR